jgi:hypothetical protein
MCSERGLSSASQERPVDRSETCYCPVPESIQTILRRIQILSFEASTGEGPNTAKRSSLYASFPNETRRVA